MGRELSDADLDRLNQLASMRDKGILTEEEFAEQKAKLFEEAEDTGPSEKRNGRGSGLIWPVLVVAVIAAIILALGTGSTSATDGTATASSDAPTTDQWQVYRKTDELTDAEVIGARALLTSGGFQTEATVECTNGSKLAYTFSFFDDKDEAAILDLNGNGGTSFVTRLNDGGVINYTSGPLRYSNSVTVQTSDTVEAADAVAKEGVRSSEKSLGASGWLPLVDPMFVGAIAGSAFQETLIGLLALADRARFKFQLSSGEVFVDINQAQGPVSQVIETCLPAKKQRLTAMQAESQDQRPATASTAATDQFTKEEQALIDWWASLDEKCRGSLGDPGNACEERFEALEALNRAGICWGKKGQVNAEYQVHRCGPDSL